MLVIYSSRTGNVRRFIEKMNISSINIDDIIDDVVNVPFILVTYTTGFGKVPDKVIEFLKTNHKNLIAVSSSGNRNWGANFAIAADKISQEYNVPILSKFELSGTVEDVRFFLASLDKYNNERMREIEVY